MVVRLTLSNLASHLLEVSSKKNEDFYTDELSSHASTNILRHSQETTVDAYFHLHRMCLGLYCGNRK